MEICETPPTPRHIREYIEFVDSHIVPVWDPIFDNEGDEMTFQSRHLR